MSQKKNELTDRSFWKDYWQTKKFNIEVPRNFLFRKEFDKITQKHKIKTAVEVGGFPGIFSIFLAKYYNVKATLIDFFLPENKVIELLSWNGMQQGDVELIEADILQFKSEKRYDLVFSCGLIEHFEDTELIIQKHIDLLSDNGVLFIEIPNFLGLNGWLQKVWDPRNLSKHHLKSMDINFLRKVMTKYNFKSLAVYYRGRYGVWLENISEKPLIAKLVCKFLSKIGVFVKALVPFETKLFSPYIIIMAEK